MDPRDCDGNIFLLSKAEPLDMSKLLSKLASDDPEEFLEWMKCNVLGRLFYCDDGTFAFCQAGYRQQLDGAVFSQLRLEDLSSAVRSNPRLVPNWEGEGSTLHWMQFIVSTKEYRSYLRLRMRDQDRRIVGVSLCPQPNPAPDACYLVACAPPLYMPLFRTLTSDKDYARYVESVLKCKLPGTDISAVRWFKSFAYWVRFDADIPSFLNFDVMYTYGLHPQGWTAGKVFVIVGEQGTGKSEKVNQFCGFLPKANFVDASMSMITTNKFNASLIKPKWICHEAGKDWYKKMNSEFLRSMVTDMTSMHDFEQKFGKMLRIMGAVMAIVVADRAGGPATVAEREERRLVMIKVAKDPKNPADYTNFHKAVHLFSQLFAHSNENLTEFREQFRQSFVNYLGPMFDYISPSGLVVPRVLHGRDGFEDALGDEQTAAVKKSSGPPAKRAKTAVSTSAASAANACAKHLAATSLIVPVLDPNVWYYLFHNLSVFHEPDSIDRKHSLLRTLIHRSWTHDNTEFRYVGLDGQEVVSNATMYSLYSEYSDAEKSTDSEFIHTAETRALAKTDAFYKMLAKFKSLMVVRHMMAMGPEAMTAWPRLLTIETALWILGLWMNYLGNGGKIRLDQPMWGDACSMQEYLVPAARLLLSRLSGRDTFSSGKHVEISQADIRSVLKIDSSAYLGMSGKGLQLRPVQMHWGPFSILRGLVREDPIFRPSDEEIASILRMIGGEALLVDKNRADYDWLISSTPTHLMKQMCKTIETVGVDGVDEQSRIYYALFADQFSDGPFGLMKKDEFYATLARIEVNVPKPRRNAVYRPPVTLRSSPADLGDTGGDQFSVAPAPVGLPTAAAKAKEVKQARHEEMFSSERSPILEVSSDEFEYPNVSQGGPRDSPTQSLAFEQEEHSSSSQ